MPKFKNYTVALPGDEAKRPFAIRADVYRSYLVSGLIVETERQKQATLAPGTLFERNGKELRVWRPEVVPIPPNSPGSTGLGGRRGRPANSTAVRERRRRSRRS